MVLIKNAWLIFKVTEKVSTDDSEIMTQDILKNLINYYCTEVFLTGRFFSLNTLYHR